MNRKEKSYFKGEVPTIARLTPPKSPMVYEKDHSRCMWGLYSVFDFRQRNSSRKLISDRKRFNKDALIDDGIGNVKLSNLLIELDEKGQGKNFQDRFGNSVGHDMENEKKLKKEDAKSSHTALHTQADSVKQKKIPHPNMVNKSFEKPEKNKKPAKKRRGCGCKNVDFVKHDRLLKVNDVAEAIVNQKLIEGKYLSRDGVNPRSKQLSDALDILNSNKELFNKLLQDPNSLLVKHIQDLRDSQAKKQDAEPECESSNETRNEELVSTDQTPSEIVVLRPDRGFEGHAGSSRPTHFSFGDMKRKFRHAMGAATRKDLSFMSREEGLRSESRGAEEVRRKFRNDVRVGNGDAEKYGYDVHRRDKIEKLRDLKARIGHEMASRNEDGTGLYRKQSPKPLQREVSSPEYDFLHLHSPGRDARSGSSVGSHMRFNPYSYAQVTYDNWRPAKEQKAGYAGSLKHNVEALIDRKKAFEANSSIRGETSDIRDSEELFSEGNFASTETSNVVCHEETSNFDVPCANQSSEATDTNEETEDSESSRLNSSLEDQSSTCSSNFLSSTPSSVHRSDNRDSSKDVGESSPISVLEQFFIDIASPTSIARQPDLDPETNADTYLRISEYVKALLKASGLNHDDKLVRDSCQSDKLFDAVNSQANQLCGGCKLIFDFLSEVLVELNDAHFKHPPWLSFVNPRAFRPPRQVEKFVTQEATKRVDLFLKAEQSQRPMEWLIGTDLRGLGAWLDIRSDAENIVVEIVEDALEDLIMEFIDDLNT